MAHCTLRTTAACWSFIDLTLRAHCGHSTLDAAHRATVKTTLCEPLSK